jgi:hypothetical protein
LFPSLKVSESFPRVLNRYSGVFMSLLRKLMRGKMVAFAMSRGSGLMSVGRLVVILRGAIVWTLRHGVLLVQLDAT